MGEDQVSGRNLEPTEHPSLDGKCAVAYVKTGSRSRSQTSRYKFGSLQHGNSMQSCECEQDELESKCRETRAGI